MQTESNKEQEGWETIDEHHVSWCYDNYGFELTIEVQRKDDKYRLMGSQPANITEDEYAELSGCPKHDLSSTESLPHTQYKDLFGAEGYGGFSLEGIAEALGVKVTSQFSRKNCQ